MYKKYYIYLLFLFILNSCIKNNNIDSKIQCKSIEIIIVNNNNLNTIHFKNKFKRILQSKLNIFINNKSENIYKLEINIDKNQYNSILSQDGDNQKLNINYLIKFKFYSNNNLLCKNNFTIFYNNTVSQYKYSEKIKNEKEDNNIIEQSAQKVLINLFKYLKK